MEAVARHGSMNRAAVELNTVQSNVTARLRTLEDQIGIPLFDRHSRGVTLTAAGQRLLPYATRIAQLLQEARSAARNDSAPQGRLTIGTLETTAALRLPPILSAYTQSYPNVSCVVTTGTTSSLLTDVIENRVDGAFVAGPIRHDDLVTERIFQEELVLVTARSVRKPSDLDGIRDLRTIVFQVGCSYRQQLDTFLAQHGLKTAQPLEFGSLDAILGCVAAGVGITVLPKAVVAAALRDGTIAMHTLPPKLARVDTVFARRRDAYVSSALSAFLAIVRPSPSSAIAAA